ncbi:MAG: alpha/beta hydrolase [Thermodesulfobacteriota bacterium]
MLRRLFTVTTVLALCLFMHGRAGATSVPPGLIAPSSDGVLISFSAHGKGDVTLIFVHGWSCDSRYWYRQVPFLSKGHRVVTIDLAGHGHSGSGRKDYTVASFGEDVKAVADGLKARKVILIGHSMGGAVIAAAAGLMPDRVLGLIGVDTLHNVEFRYTEEEVRKFVRPFEENFEKQANEFVRGMFPKGADANLVNWIAGDMSCAIPRVGISAIRNYLGLFVSGEGAKMFERLKIPVAAVNADFWPTNPEANRRHMVSFDVAVMKGVGHFPMLERPEEFNRRLSKVIKGLAGRK